MEKMKLLELAALKSRVSARGIAIRKQSLEWESGSVGCVAVEIPPAFPEILALAGELIRMEPDEPYFTGGVLWVSTWHIWSSQSDELGEFVITRMRAGGQKPSSLEKYSAHDLQPEDLMLGQALLTQVMAFQWNGFFVPNSTKVIIEVSHDGIVWAHCPSKDMLDRIAADLKAWHPKVRRPRSEDFRG